MRMIAHSSGTHSATQQPNTNQPGFLGGIFQKRERKASRTEEVALPRSTEV